MKKYKGYLIDLDGTLYRGNEIIPEAVEFIASLDQMGLRYLFLTNNSSQTPAQVAKRLQKFGFPAREDQVYTSALATAAYLKDTLGSPSVFVIGEEGLKKAIIEANCLMTEQNPEAVVVGIDREFSYEKMKKACLFIRQGAQFIGTNPDKALPTEEGLLPGAGSLIQAIAMATGVNPKIIGKPESIIIHYALKALGTTSGETLIVGDNLETDILAGVKAKIDTLLVLSGVTTMDIANQSEIKPKYQVVTLREWKL
ncbi:TIGR01457 family HAD-type hydrolase [Thermoflavimicrobium daqui]|jgi:4-nitrophenyl phosphatase|uniref:TIGR01457 family HAD-type hydrolase n=1 Tax=Thermoflavimicrobium daqui TaxID=2137476 RepID=A0A364K9X3_9BACL|nr:TIGR01457 family HAD-type hydrolase [Thermoflavimicrobium daqui]RAL27000.1 TIGR01457 family HAD-type hydrolase [Thermoflavimicrobium daqui]